MDGWIKMWNYSRFKAGPISEDMKVVIKPVFEIQVCDDRGPAVLSNILKKNNDPSDTTWFAQVLTFIQNIEFYYLFVRDLIGFI